MGGGRFTFKGRHYQREGGAWLVYAHHSTKAHGTCLNLHALSLKQSQIETRIANISRMSGLKHNQQLMAMS